MAPGSLRSDERLGLDAQDRRPGEAGNSAIVHRQGVASYPRTGLGLTRNILRRGHVFAALHCPADGHSNDAEMLGNALHTVSARAVRLSHRAIAVRPALGIVGQRLGHGSALTPWNLPQRARWVDPRLHALGELIGAQVDLALEPLPRAGTAVARSSANTRSTASVPSHLGAGTSPTMAR
jgi:hypothetical protein